MSERRKRNLLDTVLSRTSGRICVLDDVRRVRFFSSGLEQLTGWSADEIEGAVCDCSVQQPVKPIDLLTAALYPSPEVLAGAAQSVRVVLPQKNGPGLAATMTFLPIPADDASVSRIVILVETREGAISGTASLTQKLHAELTSLRAEFRRRFDQNSYVGNCPQIRTALAQAELLKNSECGYSIIGPNGSGRRHLAKLIHVSGRRHEQSVVPLECRLLTAETVLDTLRQMRRRSEEVTGPANLQAGTLLLIDAHECPREVQKWLLEDLQSEREGIRMVAIAGQPLNSPELEPWMLKEFCDLFGTLQVVIPPLHHRGDDISLLAQFFIEESRRALETSAAGMSEEFEQEIRFYRWPGNVRELKSVIIDACQNSFAEKLELEDLPFAFRAGLSAQELPSTPQDQVCSLEKLMTEFERDVILRTLEACAGNKAEAARRLGMTRPRLYRRMSSLGLDDDRN